MTVTREMHDSLKATFPTKRELRDMLGDGNGLRAAIVEMHIHDYEDPTFHVITTNDKCMTLGREIASAPYIPMTRTLQAYLSGILTRAQVIKVLEGMVSEDLFC